MYPWSFITVPVGFLLHLFFSSTVNFYFRWINSSLLLLFVIVYDMSYVFLLSPLFTPVFCICYLVVWYKF